MESDSVPEKARVWYLKGNVWVDISKELYSHVQVKTQFVIKVGGLVEAEQSGLFLGDGAFLTNVKTDVFGKSFRLAKQIDALGQPKFVLNTR